MYCISIEVNETAMSLFVCDGAQNESGKVAVYGDSLTMRQLRQKWAITLLSGYNYIILQVI